ncbi:MAG: dihydropteroate synthase [Verrucomicrobia bacterium]|nr:MAG: dihydropteroate synthase [Verrucomicrobiota bacterium]
MGILNINDDSFSGDGCADPGMAVHRACEILAAGADIVDVGAESARTNRAPITVEEEIRRLLSFVQNFDSVVASIPPRKYVPLLSINTWRPLVARTVLAAGGHILNDIGALPSMENAHTCAQYGAALVIMHSIGQPKVSHRHVRYQDVLESLQSFFEEKIAGALQAGMDRCGLVLDPGIDFAKQDQDNLAIYRQLKTLHTFELPILLPVSRKHVIGSVLGIQKPDERDAGTVACIVSGLLRGASIFRVHNVRAAVETLNLMQNVFPSTSATA